MYEKLRTDKITKLFKDSDIESKTKKQYNYPQSSYRHYFWEKERVGSRRSIKGLSGVLATFYFLAWMLISLVTTFKLFLILYIHYYNLQKIERKGWKKKGRGAK